MSVKRYDTTGEFDDIRIEEVVDGAYVAYEDYAAERAKVERMEKALREISERGDFSNCHSWQAAVEWLQGIARAALPSPPTEERTDREKNSSVDNHRLGGNSGSSMGSVGQGRLTTSPPANPSPKKPDPWGFDGLGEGGGS